MADLSANYRGADYGTDAYGDLLLDGSGDLILTSDADARGTNNVAQSCIQAISTFAGECFVNQALGLPYFQQLLGQKAPAATWDAVLQAAVLQTPGVIQLNYWKSTPDYRRRSLLIEFRAVTSQGPITYSGAVNLNVS